MGNDLDAAEVRVAALAVRAVTAGHEAAHAIAALALGVPVLAVDARSGYPQTRLGWPEYKPRIWGAVLAAGFTWEELAGWPPAEACQSADLADLDEIKAWCPIGDARRLAAELLTEHAARHVQLAAALRDVGALSGPEVAAWWHRDRPLPAGPSGYNGVASGDSALTRHNATPSPPVSARM